MPNAPTSNPPMTETINSASAAASTLFLGHNGEFWDFWLIVSVVFAALAAAAIGVTTTGSIVSHKREAAASEEALGIYKLETEGKISDSTARAAEANARAAEAKLELEKFKSPRMLDRARQEQIFEKTRPFSGTRFDLSAIPGDPEALNFAVQIAVVLEAAGWSWIEFNHPTGPFMTVYSLPGRPNIGHGGAWGVVVQLHPDHEAQFRAAARALADAVEAEGFLAAAVQNPPSESIPNHDTVHIIVGKKT